MPFEPKPINEWLLLLGTIFGILASVWIVFRRVRRYAKSLNYSISINEKLREHFGHEPAEELKLLLDELRSSHDILTAKSDIALRKLRVGIYICDGETGQCLWVSEFLGDLFGLPIAHMLGLGWSSQIEGRKQAVESWEWCVTHSADYRDEYIVTNARTGAKTTCKTEAFFIRGSPSRYIGYVEVKQ